MGAGAQFPAEEPRAFPHLVGKGHGVLIQQSCIPVQQKKRGQALLSVKGQEGAPVFFSVDEVEMQWFFRGQRLLQRTKKVPAHPAASGILPALSVIALDEGNADFMFPDKRVKGRGFHTVASPCSGRKASSISCRAFA